MQRPMLLLLDEPTAGLDLLAREQVLATVHAMLAEPEHAPTVVMITHHVEELPPATSQILLLDEGAIGGVGSPEQVLTTELLKRVYRCRWSSGALRAPASQMH
jgi:iron complex transport system ATP-binding protein